MNQLQIINRNGQLLADSRDVADMIVRPHNDLLKTIRSYMEYLGKGDFSHADFFIENYYTDSQGKPRLHFLITKKGCDMIANKMTGEKGVLFTAAYVTKFEEMENQLKYQDTSNLSPLLQTLIQMETRQNALENDNRELKEAFTTMTDNMSKVPDQAKVVDLINEYARWTRLGHNEVYNKVYETLKDQHGIDVRQRVNNERERIQNDYIDRTGKAYAESTLKKKVTGIDVMTRMGCLDKFYSILFSMLSREKIRSKLSVVR